MSAVVAIAGVTIVVTTIELATLAQQHLAYPVLHLFRSSQPSCSAPRAVALLDDVLLLVDAVDPRTAPQRPARRQLRSSIDQYLQSFGPVTRRADEGPAPPTVAPLRDAGIPLALDDASLRDLTERHADRRRRLSTVLHADGVAAPGESREGSGG